LHCDGRQSLPYWFAVPLRTGESISVAFWNVLLTLRVRLWRQLGLTRSVRSTTEIDSNRSRVGKASVILSAAKDLGLPHEILRCAQDDGRCAQDDRYPVNAYRKVWHGRAESNDGILRVRIHNLQRISSERLAESYTIRE